jgi:protein-L-isoaspartate(D-aspartate) O-methyltransferase
MGTKFDFQRLRDDLVRGLARKGIRDKSVLEAMRRVPREEFIPEDIRERSYEDCALPIEDEQTISQPFIVALMAESLRLTKSDRVLEIGTGSGYAAAVMSLICADVYSVERHDGLARAASLRLGALGFDNIHVCHDDGTKGWPEYAPYDAISVAATAPEVPSALVDQLEIGGRLVIPVGDPDGRQELLRVTKTARDHFKSDKLGEVRFVPLIANSNDSE